MTCAYEGGLFDVRLRGDWHVLTQEGALAGERGGGWRMTRAYELGMYGLRLRGDFHVLTCLALSAISADLFKSWFKLSPPPLPPLPPPPPPPLPPPSPPPPSSPANMNLTDATETPTITPWYVDTTPEHVCVNCAPLLALALQGTLSALHGRLLAHGNSYRYLRLSTPARNAR